MRPSQESERALEAGEAGGAGKALLRGVIDRERAVSCRWFRQLLGEGELS